MQNRQLTARALIIGGIGSVIVAMSSTYIALRIGALPWPTVFVALASLGILRSLGNTNLNEANITHTAMSAGGLVAGGLAFTIPGIWMSSRGTIGVWQLLGVTLAGAVWGVFFTGIIRKYLIEELKLTFPLGIAAAETLKISIRDGVHGTLLAVSFVLTAIWAAIRDWTGKIPAIIRFPYLEKHNFFVGIALYPMAFGIGYIIGPLYTLAWFIGSFLSYVLIVPTLVSLMGRPVNYALEFVRMLGIGMIIGGGLAVMIVSVVKSRGRKAEFRWEGRRNIWWLLAAAGVLLLLLSGIPLWLTFLVVTLSGIIALIAGAVDGMTGIDPMEVLAILVVLGVKLLWHGYEVSLFLVAAFVAIVAGLSGDALQDMKAGHILNTQPTYQLNAELIGALLGGIAAVFSLLTLHRVYGAMGPDTLFPAPQAFAVKSMIAGLKMPLVFASGILIGFLLQFLSLPAMVVGIGIYLPMMLSIPVAFGGIVRWIFELKKFDVEIGTAVAAGMLGGEGFTGIVIGFLKLLLR